MASTPTPFALRTTLHDGLAVVAVVGELDCDTAVQLRAELDALAKPGRVILVDLSDTEFMDCSGIGVLATSYDRQCRLGGELLLDTPRPAVSRVLELTRVDQMITVLPRVEGNESSGRSGEVIDRLSELARQGTELADPN